MFFDFFRNIFKKKEVVFFLFFMISEVDLTDNSEIFFKKVLYPRNEDGNSYREEDVDINSKI
jgi:hypothetical protein